jgi:PBP1b-binding outer membrane lipoprotein LpoB
MKNSIRSAQLACLIPLLALVAGCGSTPKRIDPLGEEAVTTMGVDYRELIEWSEVLTGRMLESGFLRSEEFGPKPLKMVVSDIENKTDLSQFPNEMVIGRMRSNLLKSGLVRFVSTYGSDGIDEMTRDTQFLKDDPLFDSSQVPELGQATVASLSLRTQILWARSGTSKKSQNTYEVRMFVTDVRNGEVVWEDFSSPVAKRQVKAGIGW